MLLGGGRHAGKVTTCCLLHTLLPSLGAVLPIYIIMVLDSILDEFHDMKSAGTLPLVSLKALL